MSHPDPGPNGKPSRNAGDKPKSTGILVGVAVVLLLVVLGVLFLGDTDEQTAEDVGTSTTDVIEPGSADGGGDEGVGLQENAAGTEADPALQTAE